MISVSLITINHVPLLFSQEFHESFYFLFSSYFWSYLLVCLSQDPFFLSLTLSGFLKALVLILKISYCTNHFNVNYSIFYFSQNPYGTTHFLWNRSIIRNYMFKSDKETECQSTSTWTVMEKNTNIQLYGKHKEPLFY